MRRLATIMFTDIVGYSAMMEKDERGTLELLAQHNAILEPLVARFGGTVIKRIGDAMLVDFSSVVEAVECAFAILEACGQFNESRGPQQSKLQLRIGVHVGDVVFQENDVFGDGVNIAQRLESQAEPGSICISEEVYKLIEKKVPIHFKLIGERKLKNIQRPMRVYVSGQPGVPAGGGGGPAKSGSGTLWAGVIALLLIAAGLAWYFVASRSGGDAPAPKPAAPQAAALTNAPAAPRPALPASAEIADYVRKTFFRDLDSEFPASEALAIVAVDSKAREDGKGLWKVEAEVQVEQKQDLYIAYEFAAALKDMGYNADNYRKALSESRKLSAELAASAPAEDSPILIKRTTGKGHGLTVPVEFTFSSEGGRWVFGKLARRAGEQELFRGKPASAYDKNALVVGSEAAMQAVGNYIQSRESFAAKVLVKQTQLQIREEEEVREKNAKKAAALKAQFAPGEMYDGVMSENGQNHFQVIFMVIENRAGGDDILATVGLNGEPGILRQLTGRIDTAEQGGQLVASAVLSTVSNSGIPARAGIPEFFYSGKPFNITLRLKGDQLEGADKPYSFKLHKSQD